MNYTTFRGLPVLGTFFPKGLYAVASLSVGGTTYQPCWVEVVLEDADKPAGNTVIKRYGMQPHLMEKA